MIDAGVLPPGALQLIVGWPNDLLDHLTGPDVVSFTGSAATTARFSRTRPWRARGVRFVAERDSLNATVPGLDAAPGTPEFDLSADEVEREMTTKAGRNAPLSAAPWCRRRRCGSGWAACWWATRRRNG